MSRRRDNKHLDLSQHPIHNTEGGILVKLFRNLLTAAGYDKALGYLVDNYHKNQPNSSTNSFVKVKQTSTVVQELKKGGITFKVFIDLIKNLLKCRKMHITVVLEFPSKDPENPTTAASTLTINLADVGSEEEAIIQQVELKPVSASDPRERFKVKPKGEENGE